MLPVAQIERQKTKYNWEFIFLGSNIDAVQTAGRFEIAQDRAVDYLADSEGTELNFKMMSAAAAAFVKKARSRKLALKKSARM